jgi:predicted short-subunit dehydrogenase-like oxidoreductase (DUF2520 family)
VALIGAGRVATALAVLLERAGYRAVAASGREASEDRVKRHLPFAAFYSPSEAHVAARSASLVVLGVPDDSIASLCSELAGRVGFHRGQWVLHLSGSVGLDALAPAHLLGADILSLHPLQSFPSLEEGIRRLPGSSVAVTALDEEGFDAGEELARDVGGKPFRLSDHAKPLYHAAAVFCSNYLVAVEGMAEHLFRLAGLPDPVPMFGPLARTALEATLADGPEAALTGPAVRGDVGTVRRNLEALSRQAPEAVAPYVALARLAADLAARSGRLTAQGYARLREELDEWK